MYACTLANESLIQALTHMHLDIHYIVCSRSVIHDVLIDTVVICQCVSPVSRSCLGGYSVAVIHGQDAANCTKMSLCMKQREKKRGKSRWRKRQRLWCAVNVLTIS